jgi:hypothetical protein
MQEGKFPKTSAYDIYKQKKESMLSYNPDLRKQELQDKIKRLDDEEMKKEEDEARILREYNKKITDEEKIALGIPLVPSISKNKLKIFSGPTTIAELIKKNREEAEAREKLMKLELENTQNEALGGYKRSSNKKRSYKKRSYKRRRRNIAKQRHARTRRHK